jgi:hypothetical protein
VEIDADSTGRDSDPELDRSGVSVLVIMDGLDLVEQRLTRTVADLARRQDLVVVCGSGAQDAGGPGPYTLTSQLREMLPRRAVVAVLVSDHPDAAREEFATIADLLDNGPVAVAVASAPDPQPVAVLLARHLQTSSLLRLDRDGYQCISPGPSPA